MIDSQLKIRHKDLSLWKTMFEGSCVLVIIIQNEEGIVNNPRGGVCGGSEKKYTKGTPEN